jgi:hypothetical protein
VSRALDHGRMLAGPLLLLGLWLPWVEGSGLLAGEQYNAYELMQLSAWLGAAEPTRLEWLAYAAFRFAMGGAFMSAMLLCFFGATDPGHCVFRAAAIYSVLTLAGGIAMTIATRGVFAVPAFGVLAVAASVALLLAPAAARITRLGDARATTTPDTVTASGI